MMSDCTNWGTGVLVDWQLAILADDFLCEPPLVSLYDYRLINPASIDLRLADSYIDLHTGKQEQFTALDLLPGDAILACTLEYVSIPEWCSATLYLKSSAARAGLDHALAGWVDPGFSGQLTLELHTHRAVTLHAGKCYIQMVVQKNSAIPERSYKSTGRYNGQTGPTESKGI